MQTIIEWLGTWINSGFGVALRLDLLVRLGLAVVLGGAIGWEREANGKPAGLRTNILICVGATLLTDLSIHFGGFAVGRGVADPARIAAQIVTGIGFLGAGTIIQARGTVTGLTTAATLWVVAGIGMAVGSDSYVEAVGATLLVLVVLILLTPMEEAIARRRPAHFRIILEPVAGAGEIVEQDVGEVGAADHSPAYRKGRQASIRHFTSLGQGSAEGHTDGAGAIGGEKRRRRLLH